jgi:hypothetical protein
MNDIVANVSVVSIEIIRSDGTREILSAVTSSKEDDDNNSLDQPGEK